MSIDWKGMRERIRYENEKIRKRRSERAQAALEEHQEKYGEKAVLSFGRDLRRSGVPGQPHSRIYAETMAIPKQRKKKR